MTLPKWAEEIRVGNSHSIQPVHDVAKLCQALAVAIEALEKIQQGQNKTRSEGMDTPSIAVSRDQLRMWAIDALAEINAIGDEAKPNIEKLGEQK